jgi:hypothetical protein
VISGRLGGSSDLPLIWRRDALSFRSLRPAEQGKKEIEQEASLLDKYLYSLRRHVKIKRKRNQNKSFDV